MRKIKPHKGGRSERPPHTRITPEVAAMLAEVLEATGLVFADWLEEKIVADHAALINK